MNYSIYILFGAFLGSGFAYVVFRSGLNRQHHALRPRIRHRIVYLVLAASLLVTAACGDDASRESAPSPADTSEEFSSTEDAETAMDDSVEADTAAADAMPPTDAAALDDAVSPSGAAASSDATAPTGGVIERVVPEWSTVSVRVSRSVTAVPVVADLRAGEHDRYNRFVVELQGDEVPAYAVQYLNERPIECGSGQDVELPGLATLELHLEPARGHTEQGTATVDHSERSYYFEALQEAEVSCDFEGVFTVVLGVSVRHPFRAFELANPARLVVDILHTFP